MAKVIKLTDNSNVTLLPITDANYVQITYNGTTKSVKDAILENEEITAAALNDLNLRLEAANTSLNNVASTTIGNTHTNGLSIFSYTTNGTTNYSYVPIATSTSPGVLSLGYVKANDGYPIDVSSGMAYAKLGNHTINGVNWNLTENILSYAVCSTAAGTTAKAVDLDNFSLIDGAMFTVKFTTTNTATAPKLNVNNTGEKLIYWHNVQVKGRTLAANQYYTFTYNQTNNRYDIASSSDHGNYYGNSSTAATTRDKAVNIDGFHLCTGNRVYLRCSNVNTTGSPRLNINGFGAKNIYYRGNAIADGLEKYMLTNSAMTFVYDGTGFQISDMSAFDALRLSVLDRRTYTDAPYAYYQSITAQYKNDGTNDMSSYGAFTLLNINPWWDKSGGPNHELAFTNYDYGIWHRTCTTGTTPAWQAWSRLLEAKDEKLTVATDSSTNVQTLTLSYSGGSSSVNIGQNINYEVVRTTMTNLSLL